MDNRVERNLICLEMSIKQCMVASQKLDVEEAAMQRDNRYIIRNISRMIQAILQNLKYTENTNR